MQGLRLIRWRFRILLQKSPRDCPGSSSLLFSRPLALSQLGLRFTNTIYMEPNPSFLVILLRYAGSQLKNQGCQLWCSKPCNVFFSQTWSPSLYLSESCSSHVKGPRQSREPPPGTCEWIIALQKNAHVPMMQHQVGTAPLESAKTREEGFSNIRLISLGVPGLEDDLLALMLSHFAIASAEAAFTIAHPVFQVSSCLSQYLLLDFNKDPPPISLSYPHS